MVGLDSSAEYLVPGNPLSRPARCWEGARKVQMRLPGVCSFRASGQQPGRGSGGEEPLSQSDSVITQMCALRGPGHWGAVINQCVRLSLIPWGALPIFQLPHCPECRKEDSSYPTRLGLLLFLQKTLMQAASFHSSLTFLRWPGG